MTLSLPSSVETRFELQGAGKMIDQGRIEELRSEIGDDDLSEVVGLFLDEADEVIARLSAAMSAKDLATELHFLKGAALNLGFSELAALCHQGEKATREVKAGLFDAERVITVYQASRLAFAGALAKR